MKNMDAGFRLNHSRWQLLPASWKIFLITLSIDFCIWSRECDSSHSLTSVVVRNKCGLGMWLTCRVHSFFIAESGKGKIKGEKKRV